jgi:cytochrome c peroxidase
MNRRLVPAVVIAALGACHALSAQGLSNKEERLAMTMSPLPEMPASPTNRFADDANAARLGQSLFFDPRLSRDGSMSCSTCHQPELGWGDGKPTAVGFETLNKHSPSILHSAYQRWFFWDGRADSLWAQVQYPLENPAEMDFTRSSLLRLLVNDVELRKEYEALFGALPDGAEDVGRFPERARPPLPTPMKPFEPAPTQEQLAAKDPAFGAWFGMDPQDQKAASLVLANCSKAIAAFERKIVTGPSRFDQFVAQLKQGEETTALTAQELRGFQLFTGKGSCFNCHFSPMFSGGEFHNVGLKIELDQPFDSGRPDGINTVRIDPMNGRGEFSDAQDWDTNIKIRYLSYNKHTYGAYKTPTLRNVAVTAPYMHDGRFATLRDVLEFYRDLPGLPPVGHREETLLPADFTDQEMEDLEAFLGSLTGQAVEQSLTHAPVKKTDE